MKKIMTLLMLGLFISLPALAAGTKVNKVYACQDNFGIELENGSWLVIVQKQVSEKKMDRMISLATTALVSGSPVTFVNATGAPFRWCGISDVKSITNLQLGRPGS